MISFTIPVRTVSALNARMHWAARARQVKKERQATALWFPKRRIVELPAVVTMVRLSPGTLDDDNLRGALKGVRDEIARQLGVDDRDARVEWKYAQGRGKAAVLVTIEGLKTEAA